jgi:hypothetical protein
LVSYFVVVVTQCRILSSSHHHDTNTHRPSSQASEEMNLTNPTTASELNYAVDTTTSMTRIL